MLRGVQNCLSPESNDDLECSLQIESGNVKNIV